ncbi:LOW QUALITY PROTEIN: reverse transcriptase [Phytophthora megakarya]|uniref:Reverse transcriptase n=1 Tax=Phytophthora megakarya TaxID=4795 RepID=A0A225VXD5_9STRA|nr:LOW QUALITY PROTEIN: reverse transcriptase [Phytophthora megakarya]
MFYTIIIPASKVDIKGSAVHTIKSGIISTGEDCIEVCKDMSGSVGTARLEKDDPGSRENRRIIAMDHIPSLPRSYKGSTELLIFEDFFSGYVIAKASGSRTAQTVEESYEECVSLRFGASEVIRHDHEPGFMSDFFPAFKKIMDQRQRATIAYRPQANGSAERMVQTTTRAFKISARLGRVCGATYIRNQHRSGVDPWRDAVLHGPRLGSETHMEAAIPMGSTRRQDRNPRRWRYRIQRHYQQAREQVNQRLREAISDRADQHNDIARPHQVEAGSRRDMPRSLRTCGMALSRVAEKIVEYAVKLDIARSPYNIFPVVHVSKIKPVRRFPNRPVIRLTMQDQDRLDFDEALLPGDSWVHDRDPDEYENLGYEDWQEDKIRSDPASILSALAWDPIGIDEADLNCGAILHEFLRDRANQNRFGMMQSHEEA